MAFVVRNLKNLNSLNYKANRIALRSYASSSPKTKDNLKHDQQNTVKENTSLMANIFRGNAVTSQVFPYPDVLTMEQKELAQSLVDPFERFFLEVNDAAKNDELGKVEENTLNKLWELGAFGIQVPNDYGGLGLNNSQYARLCEIVGANDLGVGITIGAHQSIGFKGILLCGTPEQKQKYLPLVANNQVYAAFALTEPSSGSDAGSIKCRALKSNDGKHYILNGSKIWISNGGIAEIMTVFAQTEHVDERTGEKRDKVTAFIVERKFGGVTNGPPEKKMGIKASNTAEVYFEDVKVPVENVLGKEGDGFKVAMSILNNGRFGMGATLAGTMRHCIQKATDHANNRTQFGNKIKNYEAIQEKLAQMNILQYVTESMAYAISQNMDSGSEHYHLEAAISKVFASESAWYVCDEAIQILGGMGYMKDTGLERVMRDLRIFRIFEGTNDILRLFVALTGIQYAGSNLRELQKAFKNPTANLGLIFSEASKRVKSKVGLGKTDLNIHVVPELHPYATKVSGCIDEFGAKVEELLLKHGKDIVNKQFLLNKLANAAIDIYGMSVVLSRCSRAINLNLPTAQNELLITKAWCLQASKRCMDNLNSISSESQHEIFNLMKEISKGVCAQGGVNTTHVLQ